MSEKIGKLIAARLKAAKRNQAWLAEKAGVSVNAVSKWTRTGKIARENVALVAELLELSIDELVSGEAKAPTRQSANSKLERLDPNEVALVTMFRECEPGEQELILRHASLLSGVKDVAELFRIGDNS